MERVVRMADVRRASYSEIRAVELYKKIERSEELPTLRIETEEDGRLTVAMEDGSIKKYQYDRQTNTLQEVTA